MTPRRWLAVALAGVALLLVAARVGAALYVDHAWYAALGAGALWRVKVMNTLLLRGLTGAAGGAFVFLNLYYVRHSIVSLVLPRRVGDLEIGEEVPGRYLMGAVLALSLALGALLTIPYGEWTLLAQAWRGLPFGERDPYHEVDLGFYVHWLPLEVALYHWALLVLLVVVLVVVALYALTPSLRWERGAVKVTSYVRRHLVALGAVALLLLAWSYRLDQFRLVIDGSGADGQFTFADHRVRLPANAFLVLFTAAIAVLVLLTGWMGQVRRALTGVTLVLILSIGLRQALPALVGRMRAAAGPVARERPYEQTRLSFSRRAVGLETLAREDSAPRFASLADAARAAATWDERALLRAAARRRGAGLPIGDAGWVVGRGTPHLRLVERPAGDAEPSAPWTLLSLDAAAAEPLAAITALDSADVASEGARPLAAPVVYPGARGYAIVEDAGGRVPSPTLRTPLSRLAHVWGEQNLRFFDDALGDASVRVVLRRDVRERLRALYPFFAQGSAVTPVVAERALYWTVPLYSATEWYPLSAPVDMDGGDWRSWRLAAVAVVDASTGRVWALPDPQRDRLAEGWMRMFPALFSAPASLPRGVVAQLPPAADAAAVQAATLAATGLRREASPPARRVGEGGGDTLVAAASTPFVTPAGDLALAHPLVGPGDRVGGVLVARGGARPLAAWLPLDTLAPRWDDGRERLLRALEPGASRDGREAVGAMRVLPLAPASAALALTRYRWRGDGPPELVRAALATRDTLVAGATLVVAAVGEAPRPGAPSPLPPGDLRAQAGVLYDRLRAALRAADWAAFGTAWEELGRVLGRPPR